MKRALLALSAVLLAVTACTVAAPKPFEVAGTIRWVSASEWQAVSNGGHTPEGIGKVEVRADRVRVHYTQCVAKVGSMQVTPDEQFAAANIRVGASVGLCYADVFFYGPAGQVDPRKLSKANANVWLLGVFP